MKKWLAVQYDNGETHVIPLNDIGGHDGCLQCACVPFIEDGVIVHNSYDGREIKERAVAALPDARN